MERHSAYVRNPDDASLSKYVLTRIAQRRELRLSDIHEVLSSDGRQTPPSLTHKLTFKGASISILDQERTLLQKELTLPIDCSYGCSRNKADAMLDAVQRAATPMAGVPEALSLLWFCTSRQACLAVEQQQLERHIAAVHATHLLHVQQCASRVAGTPPPPLPRYQLDHTGPLEANGTCACEKELEAAEQCMAIVLEAQADMAARVARLAQGFATNTATGAQAAISDTDWKVAMLHASWVAPGGRLAKRLAARIALLPQSHNHRFPALEQVAGEDLARDRRMAALNLRHPPHVVRYASQVAGLVEGFIESMDLHARLAAHATQSDAYDSTLPTKVSEGVWGSSEACMHHRHLYIARRALPLLLARQSHLWPEMPQPLDAQQPAQPPNRLEGPSPDTSSKPGTAQGARTGEQLPKNTTSQRDRIHVVDVQTDKLTALTPSLEGDDSASSVAALRAVCLHVDEGLKAEAAYLEACGSQAEVCTRMQLLSQGHAARWSLEDPVAAARARAAASTGGALAAAVAGDTAKSLPAHLEPKEMEAFYTLRFLKTRGDRLKVLHYLNATVSLQLQLLHDEEQEAAWVDPLVTRARKPFTCPVALAHANKLEADIAELAGVRPGSELQGGGNQGDAAKGSGEPPGMMVEGFMEPCSARSTRSAAMAAEEGGGGAVRACGFEEDFWESDEDAGVAVRRSDGRWVVYRHAFSLFRQLEDELLRVGTHYLECYAHQLHAVGRGAEVEELSRQSLLVDMWHHESQFMAARHHLLLAYMSAYRHATDFGVEDLFVQLDQHTQQSGSATAPASPRGKAQGGADAAFAGTGLYRPEFVPGQSATQDSKAASHRGGGAGLDGITANEPQPLLLGARRQLRREMMDICFRRPKLSVDDGYFVGRYFRATKTLEMETALVRQLCATAVQADRAGLSAMAEAARTAVRDAGPAGAAGARGGLSSLWQPGLPAGVVYGPLLTSLNAQVRPLQLDDGRGLMRGGAMLPSAGAAAAVLPGLIRKAVNELAEVHQLRHYLELAELRRTVLQYASVELGVLLQEEAYRAFAAPTKIPKDSKFRAQVASIGDGEAEQELQDDVALQASQLNWLLPSHVADNPLVLLGIANEVGCTSKAALEAVLCKEHLVRELYRSEVLWLVYQAQSRGLGKKMATQELQGVDWASLNVDGQPLKPDLLTDAWTACEPSDAVPLGSLGPELVPDKFCSPLQYAADSSGDEASGSYVMLGVGRAGVLGGVWRAPPLALAEYSTALAETLQIHTLAGLCHLLHPMGGGRAALSAAAQAQTLRCCMLDAAITHNQVLLDFAVRKLDLLRRMLMWQSATVEGMQPDKSMDVTVGGPPRSYRPSYWAPTNQVQPYELKNKPPPLLTDPPLPQTVAYRQAHPVRNHQKSAEGTSPFFKSQSYSSNAKMSFAASITQKVESLLSPEALAMFADVRRRLVESLDSLWMDMHALKMRMRTAACQSFVHGMAGLTGHSHQSKRLSSMTSSRSTIQALHVKFGGEADSEGDASIQPLSETDAMKLEVWSMVYLRGIVAALEGPVLRAELAAHARQLALAVLGSTGGKGNRWGLRLNAEKQCMEVDPAELGPGAHWLQAVEGGGAEGVERLEALLRDYGPLWQAVDLGPIALEAEAWEYKPPPHGYIPPGLMFLNQQGQLRLGHMWQLPTQLEVLAMGLAPSGPPAHPMLSSLRSKVLPQPSNASQLSFSPPSAVHSSHLGPVHSQLSVLSELEGQDGEAGGAHDGSMSEVESPKAGLHLRRRRLALRLEPLEPQTRQHLALGIQVAQMMWQHVRAALFKALLLAPSAQLAHGGDASHITSAMPYVPEEKPLAAALLEPKRWRSARSQLKTHEDEEHQSSPGAGSPKGVSEHGPSAAAAASAARSPSAVLADAEVGALDREGPLEGSTTASNRHAAANRRGDQGRGGGGGDGQQLGSCRAGRATGDGAGQEEGPWLRREYLSGRALLDHMGQICETRMAPFLPGALLVSSLSGLHTKLAYLMQPKGKVKGRASTAAVASNVVPAAEAIQHLRREAGVQGLAGLLAVVRAKDAFTMMPTRHMAWHLAGGLEVVLARSMVVPPSEQPILYALAMLRMRDAERVALHNEMEHVQLVVERIIQEECGVSPVLQPAAAVELAQYVVTAMWAHDRLRDGLVWRAMLMETPTQYPGVIPHESDFLRRYHDAPLALLPPGPVQPVSPSIRTWMEHTYKARIADKVLSLLTLAASYAPSAASAGGTSAKFSNTAGHPAWVARSPVWGSREGRMIEAALCIMKQEVDMQASQVALLRLHKDCAQLAGAAVQLPPTSPHPLHGPHHTIRAGLQACNGSGAMAAPLSAPLQVLVRHLVARKQLSTQQEGAGLVYEVSAEDMAAWLAEAVAAAAAEGMAAAQAACRGAAQERAMLAQLSRYLHAKVAHLASEHGKQLRHHVIQVESHLVDRAMLLLQELSFVRRAAVRSQEDAATAHDLAYMAAQTHYANVIKDLQNALLVAQSNMVLQRADMQRATMEAMMEVRRETLQKAFGSSTLARAPTTKGTPARALKNCGAAGGEGEGEEGSAEEGDAAQTLPMSPTLSSRLGSTSRGGHMAGAAGMPRSATARSHASLPRAASTAVSDVQSHASGNLQQGASKESNGGGIMRILELESEIEALEAEIIDMQRAIVKVQTWFKMRSSAFQAACMKEVVEGRERVAAIEGMIWEMREAYELKLENASIQLKATQADLEVAVAGLARSSMNLTHALSSNKRLLTWKVTQAPRVEAMRTLLASKNSSLSPSTREDWLEWMGSKQGLLSREPLLQAQQAQQQQSQASDAAVGGWGQGKQEAAAADSQQGWLAERQALLDEVALLRSKLHQQQQQQASALAPLSPAANADDDDDGSKAGGAEEGEGSGVEEDEGQVWDASALPGVMALQELQAAYTKAVSERSELQRLLEVVRALSPGAVQTAEQQLGLAGRMPGTPPPRGHPAPGPSAAATACELGAATSRAGLLQRSSSGRQLAAVTTAAASPLDGPLSTFSPRSSLPLGLHSLTSTSPSSSNASPGSTTHPFIRSLLAKPSSSAPAPATPTAAPAAHSSRLTRPRSAATASALTATQPSAVPSTPPPGTAGPATPASISVAGPRHTYSPSAPAMRVAAPHTGPPARAARPSSAAVRRSQPGPRAQGLGEAGPGPTAPAATQQVPPPHVSSTATPPTGATSLLPSTLSTSAAAMPAQQQGSAGEALTSPNSSPSPPRFVSVQTTSPSLQVKASKLSTDPVPATAASALMPAATSTSLSSSRHRPGTAKGQKAGGSGAAAPAGAGKSDELISGGPLTGW